MAAPRQLACGPFFFYCLLYTSLEVAKLFIGIFISMIPAIAILRAGTDGALAGVINMVFHEGQPVNAMFFWLKMCIRDSSKGACRVHRGIPHAGRS